MRLLKAFIISRPLVYVIGPAIFIIPIFLYNIPITPLIVIHAILLTFPLCFLLFGINDVHDIDTDSRNLRKRSILEGNVLKPCEIPDVLTIAASCAFLLFIPSMLRMNILNLAATSILVLSSYLYSSPPLRLKEKPPLDSFTNAIIIYSIFLMGLSYGPGIAGFPEKLYYLLFGIMGIHIFSTIMDYTPDIGAGVTTFSTIFGKRLSALLSLMIFLFILIHSGIKSRIINTYVITISIVAGISLIRPDEKLASILFKILFVLFIILIIAYIITII